MYPHLMQRYQNVASVIVFIFPILFFILKQFYHLSFKYIIMYL